MELDVLADEADLDRLAEPLDPIREVVPLAEVYAVTRQVQLGNEESSPSSCSAEGTR